eukprot:15335341-Ditylum_brightwellii.AAC.1
MVADHEYKGDHHVCHPDPRRLEQQTDMGAAYTRHKTLNGWLKKWAALKQIFCIIVSHLLLVIELIKYNMESLHSKYNM